MFMRGAVMLNSSGGAASSGVCEEEEPFNDDLNRLRFSHIMLLLSGSAHLLLLKLS